MSRRNRAPATPAVRTGIRKTGRKAFKEGTHPQMWRKKKHGGAFARLGPMGSFSNSTILRVEKKRLFYDGLAFFEQQRKKGVITGRGPYSNQSIGIAFKQEIHNPLLEYTIERIGLWAPRDTGALRDAMETVVKRSTITVTDLVNDTGPYLMQVGTPGIEYAKPVNKMPTWALKHPGRHKPDPYRGRLGRFGDPLEDPNAKKGWYNLILVNSRNLAKRLIKNFIKRVITPELRNLAKLSKKKPQAFVKQMFRFTTK